MKREEFADGTEVAGVYVRAVRVGRRVYVSGTTAVDEHGQVTGEDAAAQTAAILAKIEAVLERAGAGVEDVVRVVIYCIDVHDAPAIIGTLQQRAGKSLPAATLVEVKGLLRPELKVEIQIDAVISDR